MVYLVTFIWYSLINTFIISLSHDLNVPNMMSSREFALMPISYLLLAFSITWWVRVESTSCSGYFTIRIIKWTPSIMGAKSQLTFCTSTTYSYHSHFLQVCVSKLFFLLPVNLSMFWQDLYQFRHSSKADRIAQLTTQHIHIFITPFISWYWPPSLIIVNFNNSLNMYRWCTFSWIRTTFSGNVITSLVVWTGQPERQGWSS